MFLRDPYGISWPRLLGIVNEPASSTDSLR